MGAAIPWYVMTSEATDTATRRAFADAQHFGLPARDVFFLRQGMITSFDFEGKLILERPDRIFVNPDGHGGRRPRCFSRAHSTTWNAADPTIF
jgi:UDP-N-acetylglucosamine/UDP-N-acetylgalactosamine diphosphorylase